MSEMETLRGLIDQKDLLEFSQNLSVDRNYMGNTLFPDQKTQYMDAEFYRLIRNGNLPMAAMVHSLDAEAAIGSRIPVDKVEMEKLLIKEKINQTEALRKVIDSMQTDTVREYVFDDIARQAEKVITRAEMAKMEVLSSGKMTITENALSIEVDYGVPDENRVSSDWSDPEADILGDLRAWRQISLDNGIIPDRAVTTERVLTEIMTNERVQRAIFGTIGTGTLPTLDQVNTLFMSQVGITVESNEERYAVPYSENGEPKLNQARMFPEDTFVLISLGQAGNIGTGLWGVTPEEELQGGAFDMMRQQQYVTVTQWSTPDPVAVWTKASALFTPVLANPYGHVIANVAAADNNEGAEG